MSTNEFKARNKLLIQSLVNKQESPFQVVASELYEEITGNTLCRATDPVNGEDYMYKSGENECLASLRLHPEVVTFYNWRDGIVSSSLAPEIRLCTALEPQLNIVSILSTRFDEFQAEV